jgi:hypothetical protein
MMLLLCRVEPAIFTFFTRLNLKTKFELYLDNHWLYFIIYSINSIISIIKGDVMVKSHLLRIIQLFNLLSLELVPESYVDARIYSILCSKERVFLFSSLL